MLPATAGSPFTSVSASWTVPTLDCVATPAGEVAVWVGVDGVGGTAGAGGVFQAGTWLACQGGIERASAWWEAWPMNAEQNVGALEAGDVVSAHVWQTRSGWWWQVVDDTTGASYAAGTQFAYGGPGGTADWVVEDPTADYRRPDPAPLASFSPVTFTGMATVPSISAENGNDIWDMAQGGEDLVTAAIKSSNTGAEQMSVRHAVG